MKKRKISLLVFFLIGIFGVSSSFQANASCHSCDGQLDDKRCVYEGVSKTCNGSTNWLLRANCAEEPKAGCLVGVE